MNKPKSSPRKETVFVARDLEELRKNPTFQKAVQDLGGNIMGAQNLCDQFLIGDAEWMRYVIQRWDGKSQLPRADDPSITRHRPHLPNASFNFSPVTLGYWEGNFFSSLKGFCGGVDEYIQGSPRLQKQSLYQRDESGAEWMTLRVRLTPDLTSQQIQKWTKRAVSESKKYKKPSMKPLILAKLNEEPEDEKSKLKKKSINAIGEHIREKIFPQLNPDDPPISKEHAKKIAREWKNPKK